MPADEVLHRQQVTLAEGLGGEEVARRRALYGPNEVSEKAGLPAWVKFLRQFNSSVVYILLSAGAGCLFLRDYADAAVIFGVVFVNAVVGFIQESRAERAIGALNAMIVTEATVRRDGRKLRIPSGEIVPGDVVLLQSGDRVPADLRLVEVKNLQ